MDDGVEDGVDDGVDVMVDDGVDVGVEVGVVVARRSRSPHPSSTPSRSVVVPVIKTVMSPSLNRR